MTVLRLLTILIVLVVCAVAAMGTWVWHNVRTTTSHQASDLPVEVARGEALEQILNTLQQKGVIDNSLALRLYMKVKQLQPVVQAGTYYFPSPISPLGALDKLQQGPKFDRITVIEGWNRWDVADALTRLPGLHLQNKQDALALLNASTAIEDLDPHAQSLEGYMFPDTYFLVSDSTAGEVVSDMVKRFRQVWCTRLEKQAKTCNMSAHDAVVRASIIETEAKLKSERPIIASVIENRLKRHMPLSMDSTIVYASKMVGAWRNDGKVYQSDIDRNSPYNTRKNSGLPPGPVGNPGLSSLQAAVEPAHTNYIYYVRNPGRQDGAHNFYSDEKSFNEGVQALRDWEQKQARK
jgi:UPF0755 protein